MKMRKWYIALLTLLALTACWQESVLPEEGDGNSFDPSKLRFNLTIEHPAGATKGVKKVWKDGDKVFLFINGITSGYLTATLTSTSGVSTWTTAYVGGTELASLGASGTLQAVYLPYGNDATPSYDNGKWTFSGETGGTDTYYFYASNIPYTVSDGVLSATVKMVKPTDYVQFFIPCENATNATGTIQLACNGLRPAGFVSISAADGTVTEKEEVPGAAGTVVPGYPDILEGQEGYYVSGKPVDVTDNDYYFALQKVDGSYAHFFKNRSEGAMTPNGAYKLPDYNSWLTVGGSQYVTIAGKRWKTVNEGASHPWTMGDQIASFNPGEGEGLPTADDWGNLLNPDVATWKEMVIMGQKGYLIVSKESLTNYIFLPCIDSDTDYWIDGGSVVRINTDVTPPNGATPAPLPAKAYARLIEKQEIPNYFRIIATVAGTTVTFDTDYAANIQYSVDGGITWVAGTTPGTLQNVGDQLCVKGTRANYKNDGGDQYGTPADHPLFKTSDNKLVYIAGNIMSLLNDAELLSESAFQGTFSRGKTGNTENSITYIDISDTDPLYLPVTNLADKCYIQMFRKCTSLTHAPTFTVNGAAYRCCYNMFRGCSNLSDISTISLPANQMYVDCYREMFRLTGITSIASDFLPATTLASSCYMQMFNGCAALTNAPVLPATTLANNCYDTMFSGCSQLASAPALPATTLASSCYNQMFYGCSKLTSAPALPATTLASNCYYRMFMACTKLTASPILPATTLANSCYKEMFKGCKALISITCLATNISASECTKDWVAANNNTALPAEGTFTKAPSMESWTTGNNGIPSGWTVTDYTNP